MVGLLGFLFGLGAACLGLFAVLKGIVLAISGVSAAMSSGWTAEDYARHVTVQVVEAPFNPGGSRNMLDFPIVLRNTHPTLTAPSPSDVYCRVHSRGQSMAARVTPMGDGSLPRLPPGQEIRVFVTFSSVLQVGDSMGVYSFIRMPICLAIQNRSDPRMIPFIRN